MKIPALLDNRECNHGYFKKSPRSLAQLRLEKWLQRDEKHAENWFFRRAIWVNVSGKSSRCKCIILQRIITLSNFLEYLLSGPVFESIVPYARHQNSAPLPRTLIWGVWNTPHFSGGSGGGPSVPPDEVIWTHFEASVMHQFLRKNYAVLLLSAQNTFESLHSTGPENFWNFNSIPWLYSTHIMWEATFRFLSSGS